MDIDQEKIIKNLIRRKSISEIKKFLNEISIDQSLKECLKNFPKMHGPANELENYLDQLKSFNNDIENDIYRMIKFSDIIKKAHADISINFDFCELKGFDYENDILFSAYIENDSHEVAIGGKYDLNSAGVSGIGFSIDVRNLIKNQFLNKTKYKLINKSGKWLTEDNND